MTDERPTLTISTMTSGPHKATYLVATSNTELFDLYDLTMSGLWAELNKYPATCAAVRCIELKPRSGGNQLWLEFDADATEGILGDAASAVHRWVDDIKQSQLPIKVVHADTPAAEQLSGYWVITSSSLLLRPSGSDDKRGWIELIYVGAATQLIEDLVIRAACATGMVHTDPDSAPQITNGVLEYGPISPYAIDHERFALRLQAEIRTTLSSGSIVGITVARVICPVDTVDQIPPTVTLLHQEQRGDHRVVVGANFRLTAGLKPDMAYNRPEAPGIYPHSWPYLVQLLYQKIYEAGIFNVVEQIRVITTETGAGQLVFVVDPYEQDGYQEALGQAVARAAVLFLGDRAVVDVVSPVS